MQVPDQFLCRVASLLYALLILTIYASPSFAQSSESGMNIGGIRAAVLYAPQSNFNLEASAEIGENQEDRWLSFDKFQHAGFSFVITLGSQYSYETKLDMNRPNATILSVSTAVLVGLAKEIYDYNFGPSRHFSHKDLIADGAGILLAFLFIIS